MDAAIFGAATKVAIASVEHGATNTEQAKTGLKSKCCNLVSLVLWGNEGAENIQLKVSIVGGAECIFLVAVLLDILCGGALKEHGIRPREFPMGLIDIFFAPFLHRNIFHLLINSLPFGVLSLLVLLRERGIYTYFLLTAITVVFAGVMVWTLGSTGSNHIGSSGLIFSYFGYLIVTGIFRRNLRDFIIGAVVFIMYSSIFWGILPVDERISWEAHLFGLITGCVFGFIDARLALQRERQIDVKSDEEQQGLLGGDQ